MVKMLTVNCNNTSKHKMNSICLKLTAVFDQIYKRMKGNIHDIPHGL